MKRIGPLIFLAALIWSWNIVHSESSVSFSTHVNIQSEFRDLLLKSIQEKRPQAQNIQILELWTKNLAPHKQPEEVEVHVTYAFDTLDPDSSSFNHNEISAIAILKKDIETRDTETWILESYTPTRDDIQFTEGLRITAGTADNTTESTENHGNSSATDEERSSDSSN